MDANYNKKGDPFEIGDIRIENIRNKPKSNQVEIVVQLFFKKEENNENVERKQ